MRDEQWPRANGQKRLANPAMETSQQTAAAKETDKSKGSHPLWWERKGGSSPRNPQGEKVHRKSSPDKAFIDTCRTDCVSQKICSLALHRLNTLNPNSLARSSVRDARSGKSNVQTLRVLFPVPHPDRRKISRTRSTTTQKIDLTVYVD